MKRDRIILYLAGLLSCVVLAGCTAGAVEDIVPEGSRLVTLGFGKPDLGMPELLTRAEGAVSEEPTPLPVGTTVRIGAYFAGSVGDSPQEASFSAVAPSFEATYVVGHGGTLSPCLVDDDGKRVEGVAKELTVKEDIYDFYAVSPARPLRKGGDGRYGITGIPHKEDVMTSFVRGVTVTADNRLVRLGTFRRKCAMLVFNVAPSPGNAMPFVQLYGTGLVIKGISSSGASLIAGSDTGIPPTGGGGGEDAKVVFEAAEFEPVEPGSDPDNCGLNKTKGIVLPKDNRPFDVEITVVKESETATLRATIDKSISFDEGRRYIFTLEVKNSGSSLLMKVLDWNVVVFTDNSVGAPDSPYPDPDINEGIGTTIVVAKWTEIVWSGNGDIGGSVSSIY